MRSFEYAAPKTTQEAIALLADKWGETEILGGGTDLLTSMKQEITQPRRLVALRNIPELGGIKGEAGHLRIGAMTRLHEFAAHKEVQKHFPSLVTAVQNIASEQILNAGTVGGDLCQRPRCWYFRNGLGLLGQEGQPPRAREGENRYHAIFGTDSGALFVNPSSLAPGLIALGAAVTIEGPKGKTRQIPAAEFFRAPKSDAEREYVLNPAEILTAISIPIKDLKNATYEIRHRRGLDWPYVTASVAFAEKNGMISDARVVLGHVAATPWIAKAASDAMKNTQLDASAAEKSAEAALQGAKPLSGNRYKLQLVKTAVKRALLAAQAA
ncbi:MAG TPA: FAD binding domain-containing protein [Verrucomicrobiae bacterium]|nr:FAD binding domain-containing protein [Verrucomicrobiae bacterium]